MSARDPWRALLGRGVALVTGLSDEEAAAAVDVAERVRGHVQLGAAVVERLRVGRGRRRPAELASPGVEMQPGAAVEIVDAEVVDDAPTGREVAAVVVVATPVRRSRYD